MKKRTFALIMALVLMLSVAIPGTLAVSLDGDSTEATFSLDTDTPVEEAPVEEVIDEPAEDVEEDIEEAPVEEGEEEEAEDIEAPAEVDVNDVTVNDVDATEAEPEDEADIEADVEADADEAEDENEAEEEEEPEEAEEEPVEEIVTETVVNTYTGIRDCAPPFTSAGPLIVYDTPALMSLNDGIMLLADDEETTPTPTPTTNTSGLELKKKAEVSEDGEGYTITLEAYATGESVTTYVKDGVDIVLMLDLSNYMGKATTTTTTETVDKYTEVESRTQLKNLSSKTQYYYKDGDGYYQVNVTSTGDWEKSYTITYEKNGQTYTIVSNKDGNTSLDKAGNNNSSVTLWTKTGTEEKTTTTTTYDPSDLTKLNALKTAVNSFIDKVHQQAPASRIAIVTYADSADVKSGTKAATDGALVTVNDAGVTTLKAIVNGLTIQGGASNSHYAAADAVKIFQAVPTTSAEYSRKRVAILFSAGVPGTGWATENKSVLTTGNSIAQATMTQAYILKSNKGTLVTAPGGNVDGGAAWSGFSGTGIYQNTVYTGCGATFYSVGLDIPTSGDPTLVSMKEEPYKSGALANEYFWRSSSHRLNGTHIFGEEAGYTQASEYEAAVVAAFGSQAKEVYNSRYNGTSYGSLYYFYPDSLTRNQTDGYYLTTTSGSDEDLARLNSIFDGIAGQIVTEGGTSTTLGASTVIKDIITPQFKLPDGTEAKDITVEIYDFDGMDGTKYTFKSTPNTTIEAPTASISTDGTTVSVTGFDFSANWCGTSDNQGNVTNHGSKLVISFKVVPKDGFLGGNAVLTNEEESGVYKDSTETEPLDTFEQPTVNEKISADAIDISQNVYLGGYYGETITLDEVKANTTVKVGGVTLDLTQSDYGLADWQKEYVAIEVTYTDAEGNQFTEKELTDDMTVTVTVTVKPTKQSKADTIGTPNGMDGETGSGKTTVNVFTPVLTFKDSTVYYGDTVPSDYSGNYESTKTVWKHGETLSTDKNVTMKGDEPILSFSYTPDASKIVDNKIATKDDIPVDVKVEIKYSDTKTWDVTNYVTFKHTDCTDRTDTLPEGKEFLLHVKTCSLTITKAAANGTTIGNDEYFVFTVKKDNQPYTQVTIQGTGSVTLSELPVGTYTVEEDTSTAWRYTSSMDSNSATLSKDNSSATLTCTNTLSNNNWLNHFAQVINTYGVNPNEKQG